MNMRIWFILIWIMKSNVCYHAVFYKRIKNKLSNKNKYKIPRDVLYCYLYHIGIAYTGVLYEAHCHLRKQYI